MNSALNYFIDANLYLVCFYLLYQVLLVRDKHFRFNRAFLLSGIFLSLSLPLLSYSVPQAQESSELFEGYMLLPAVTIASAQTESVGFIIKWWHVIGIIYGIGVLLYLGRLVWQIGHIVKYLPLLNSARERKSGYTLITTNGEIPTCSFFKFLFWDKTVGLNEDQQKQILEHELAHIKQWHSIDVLLIEILRTFFWFNPVAHLIKSRISEVHEYLADHHATRKIDIDHYSKLLSLQIFKNFDFELSNNFHKSHIVKRIRMLKSGESQSIWVKVGLLVPSLTFLIVVLACDITDLDEIQAKTTNESGLKNDGSTADNRVVDYREVFLVVENAPMPKDGMKAYYEYVANSMKYPEEAKQAGIEGKVFVEFIVDKEGQLTNIKTVKGIGAGCDMEAERVIKESAAWNPGLQNGNPVNVQMILPVTFKLN